MMQALYFEHAQALTNSLSSTKEITVIWEMENFMDIEKSQCQNELN